MRKQILFIFLLFFSAVPRAFADPGSEEEGWIKVRSLNGVTTYRKKIEGSSIVAFKGETVIDAPVSKIASVLSDTSRKKEWVHQCLEAEDVRILSPTERIEYNKTDAPWPVKDRDFVFRATTEIDQDNRRLVIRIESIEDLVKPELPDAIRGKLYDSRYILTSLENGTKTNVIVQIHADPKGEVPKWIVNLFQRDWPRQTLEGIKKQVAKPNIPEHPLVKVAFQ